MKMLLILMCISVSAYAQSDSGVNTAENRSGIKFVQNKGWEQILKISKRENKYIFLDCFATWCGPCKLMDKEVYPMPNVGEYMNANFISVKVQMDTAKSDNEGVRHWYADASNIKREYKVTAFPTYLFFAPDGEIVHRGLGAIRDTDFIKLATNALTPQKQFYTLLESYKKGKRDYTIMPYLATKLKDLEERDLSEAVAREYINGYLNNLKEEDLFEKGNIDFIISFMNLIRSEDKYFRFFYENGEKIDELMNNKGLSNSIVNYVITSEEINPKLWRDGKPVKEDPDWEKLITAISVKYDKAHAERTVLDAQLKWYDEKKDWQQVIKYNIKEKEKYGLDTSSWGRLFLNNMIYETIFMHSNDKEVLNKGIDWMEVIIKIDPTPNHMDTYANLLYKSGRFKEGMDWEEKAMKLESEKANADKRTPDNVFRETLNKMKRGEPTWLQNN